MTFTTIYDIQRDIKDTFNRVAVPKDRIQCDVLLMRDIEKEIIDFIDQEYNTKKYFLCGPKRTITLDTSIRDDLKLVFEDSEELLQEYFKRWNIDSEGFDILNYLNPEYFGSKEPDPRKPLTVGMLVESAKAGRWLYS